MGAFKNWFNEMAAATSWKFGKSIPNLDTRDDAGLKHMSAPGFRDSDRARISMGAQTKDGQRYSAPGTYPAQGELTKDPNPNEDVVANKLTKATEKYGIHWVLDYFEPPEGMEEDNPDHWQQYRDMAVQRGQQKVQAFSQSYNRGMSVQPMPPPDPNNTIVYIKPTSRVHGLSPHEQIHNIGHAIWLRNPDQMARAKVELQKAVQVLQQSAHEADPNLPPPSEAETTIILARLIDLLSYQRALVLNPGDLDSTVKTALTSFQNFDEVIFELLPAFVNAGGQINLYPRGPGKVAKFDRAGAIPPNAEVTRARGVRPWVWAKMAADRSAWAEVSKIITGIIVECLHASTWAKKGGPIFPYQKLTTKP